ncbi:esterase FE4-like isoform X1 [Diaphorina citri]|uniref:Carboxylic ester hydrolase n=2 Tax=Diaphorina citri TaxID=121845 RepID=A0A1S3CX13_DIACI|nr:esterase FE4-like isoform X1 [Diaphorina citri]
MMSFSQLSPVWILLAALHLAHGQVVQINQGRLRGTAERSRNGVKYFSFLGIPYAQAPEGELRLKDPQPHPGWSDTKNATEHGNECPQRNYFNHQLIGSDNCLFLNVYTPKIDPNAKLPVMVYIHGGAFKGGNTRFLKEKFIMDKNIVYVAIQYRIGILGFMSFLDDVIPGNFGLKDQIFALKWVQDNIAHFGGDPSRVTIFGGSAGAAAVDYLVISPLAKGLFHNAIIQGGTATSPWAYIPQTVAKQRAEAVATLLGCPSKPTTEALACMRDIPSDNFIIVTDKFLEWDLSPLGPFSPITDSFMGAGAVVPDHPLALPPNPVNIILGYNSYEGNMIASMVCFNEFRLARDMEVDLPRRLALLTNLQDQVKYSEKAKVADRLFEFYLNSQNISKDNVYKFADLGTDILFGHPSFKAALNYYKKVPLYFYLYDITPRITLLTMFGNCTHLRGPSHGEEIVYFFNDIIPNFELTPEEHKLSHRLLDLWTSFASTGVPSDTWTPVASDRIEYLHMTNDGFKMARGLYEDRMRFVDTLPLLNNQYNLRHEKTEL